SPMRTSIGPRSPNSNVVSEAVGHATRSRKRPMCRPRSAHVMTRIVALWLKMSTAPLGCFARMRSTTGMERAAIAQPLSPPDGGIGGPQGVVVRLRFLDLDLLAALPFAVADLAKPVVEGRLDAGRVDRRLRGHPRARLRASVDGDQLQRLREDGDLAGLGDAL